jgi:hypothetical protein
VVGDEGQLLCALCPHAGVGVAQACSKSVTTV